MTRPGGQIGAEVVLRVAKVGRGQKSVCERVERVFSMNLSLFQSAKRVVVEFERSIETVGRARGRIGSMYRGTLTVEKARDRRADAARISLGLRNWVVEGDG